MIERDELVRRIRLGEDSTLELKRVLLAGFSYHGTQSQRICR